LSTTPVVKAPIVKKIPNPIDKHVGGRVRMRRLMVSRSQEKLGDKLGLTFQQVQKYEKGVNRIGASRLQHIGEILGVSVAFFFEGAPATQPVVGFGEADQTVMSEFLSTSEGLQLTRAFMKIRDARVRRKVLDLVSAMAGEDDTLSM
jgi:transcriptional regulator with XRE-family HTH domain